MSDRVSIHIENHIADVRLDRADKMNALDRAMFEGIMLEDPQPGQAPDWRRNWLEDWGPFTRMVG